MTAAVLFEILAAGRDLEVHNRSSFTRLSLKSYSWSDFPWILGAAEKNHLDCPALGTSNHFLGAPINT